MSAVIVFALIALVIFSSVNSSMSKTKKTLKDLGKATSDDWSKAVHKEESIDVNTTTTPSYSYDNAKQIKTTDRKTNNIHEEKRSKDNRGFVFDAKKAIIYSSILERPYR